MAVIQAVCCDVCGKQKQEVNHWFKAHATLRSRESFPGFSVYPAAEDLAAGFIYLDLCGQECVVKALNKWMQEQAA